MRTGPLLKDYDDRNYYGIRFVAPYRGMYSRVADYLKKLERWTRLREGASFGPRFLRYCVIDMRGNMELEVGVFGDRIPDLHGEFSPGVLPGGRYATLQYRGLGLAANKELIAWIPGEGYESDRMGVAQGDAFASRYEAYLTDPRVEPRKKQWDIELAIKLKD